MQAITIYHNPSCSKSCATLALLEENDVNPEIIYYLESPPSSDELRELLAKLNLDLRELLRSGEKEYADLGLDDTSLSEEILFDIVYKHPQLLQRPIVVRGDRAILGRPPENVLSLLEE
ncbi:MAG: arsenate reductase (glutaredoxin) [Gammaproteobacteria bacterium]|jgi:arsenate reductase|nr:arsenate reductase (glutaredoxin) [Gammaproteobacteria bacterium]MDP6534913.1 arsenate reductase (glutaredoxin) [Gammaproteobacteria bacterium]MDP6731990.1 arsenate reductase (glutaredoxin) [Gammaproteobacteria bacterium]HAJ75087.1 arsenate reductase (glutaredoxin) [Gammaproteobacteria bacterium]|tara:strand:- start:2339 stop:2695 length:357 start_codon:yes stop_codon:yes gene_type:complete